MNKLEILIQGRVEDLRLSTESQTWKHLAFIDTDKVRNDKCWDRAMEYSDRGCTVREFSHKLVGEKFVKSSSDAVLFDPRVTAALVLWSDEHNQAIETLDRWESAQHRLKGVA